MDTMDFHGIHIISSFHLLSGAVQIHKVHTQVQICLSWDELEGCFPGREIPSPWDQSVEALMLNRSY